ncbi:hypothetical protein BS47DRAFT_1349778, partial [Hydnum rufescens UP504]
MRMRAYPVGLNPLPERLRTARDPYQRLQGVHSRGCHEGLHVLCCESDHCACCLACPSIFLLRELILITTPSQDMPCGNTEANVDIQSGGRSMIPFSLCPMEVAWAFDIPQSLRRLPVLSTRLLLGFICDLENNFECSRLNCPSPPSCGCL